MWRFLADFEKEVEGKGKGKGKGRIERYVGREEIGRRMI